MISAYNPQHTRWGLRIRTDQKVPPGGLSAGAAAQTGIQV